MPCDFTEKFRNYVVFGKFQPLASDSRVALVKLYDHKNALVAADILNDKVLPFFETEEVRLLRILTDRGSEYCGNREHHEY